MLESVQPYRHLFLATYTVQVDDTWCGYTKVCAARPDSVWDPVGTIHKFASGDCSAEGEAHDKALATARGLLDRLFAAHEARMARASTAAA